VPFLWDCLRLPYGAKAVSQIMHGFVTGVVNVLRIYATNATGFAGLDLQDCLVSFTDGWWCYSTRIKISLPEFGGLSS